MSGWGTYENDSLEGQTISDILKEKGLAYVLRRCRDYASVKRAENIEDDRMFGFWLDKQSKLEELIEGPQSRW